MKNTIIYLIGFPGVGKLTIAKEICKRENFVLVDNHLISNPILSIFPAEKFYEGTPYRTRIRNIVLEAIAKLGDKDTNYMLTNVLREEDMDWYQATEEMANSRQSAFFPIILNCSIEENRTRIQNAERALNHKSTLVEDVDSCHKGKLLSFSHPNKMELDVTSLSPSQAADRILKYVRSKA